MDRLTAKVIYSMIVDITSIEYCTVQVKTIPGSKHTHYIKLYIGGLLVHDLWENDLENYINDLLLLEKLTEIKSTVY